MASLKHIGSSVKVREAMIFAGVFALAVGIFVLLTVIGEQALQPYLGSKEWIVPALALLIVTFALRPLERLVYNTAGRLLLKKRYEYRKALQDAAVGMATIRDPGRLLGLIVHIVSKKMGLDNVSILIYEDKHKEYRLKATRGERKPQKLPPGIRDDDPLIAWLRKERKPILREGLQREVEDEKTIAAKSMLTSDSLHIQEWLQMLNASVGVPSFYRDELIGILVLGNKKSGEPFSQEDLDLFNTLADEAAIAIKNSQLYFEIDKRAKETELLYEREHRLFMHASVAFAAAIDARDPYTHGHSERVTNYSLAMLDEMNSLPLALRDKELSRQRLRLAAVLHDIGKIGISDDILHKPDGLNPEEKKEMERHSAIGADIVSHIKGLLDIVGTIRHHHERYDGKGYPDGLKAEDIPFMARIITVSDTYDAITSDRTYRKGLPAEMAKEEIKKNASVQFDPYLVEVFLKAFEKGDIKGGIVVESPLFSKSTGLEEERKGQE